MMVEDRARENAPRIEPRPRIERGLPHVASRERSLSAGKRAVEPRLGLGAPTGFVSRVTSLFRHRNRRGREMDFRGKTG